MNKERIRFYAYLTVTVLGAAVAAIVFFKYLFVAILPFLIAWATAFLLRPAVNKISLKTKIPSKLVSAVLTIVFVFAGLALAAALAFLTVKEAWEFFSRLAADKRVIDVLAKITNPIGMLFGEDEISAEVVAGIENAIKTVSEGLFLYWWICFRL